MRTSRISQETSKIVQATSSPLRRSTRASLGRFTHNVNSGLKNEEDSDDDAHTPPAVDIEDIIAPHHKRKRSITSTPQKTKTIKTEIEDTVTFSPSPKKDRKSRKPARKIKTEDGGEAVEPPSDWEEIYSLVMAMRKIGIAQNAAVDTMGCESLAQDNLSPRDRRFQTLVALMLSSQTKDTTNAIAMGRLQNDLPACEEGKEKGLTLENILAVDPVLLNELIWVVGFHNNKTRYIKATAEILRDKYDGDIPDTIEGLMSLPGVGPKMGYLCLSAAWGKDEGIGVDVHVHRITNLWGWHGKETKSPEETRLALQSWLPRDKWHEINWLLVGFGQTVCLPVGRKCGDCEVGLKGLCRSAERGKISIGRKKREEIIKTESGEVVGVEEKNTKEEILVMEGVVNAEEDVGVKFKDGKIVDVEVEESDVQEGLSKEEETKAIEEMVTAPGQFEKALPKRRKR